MDKSIDQILWQQELLLKKIDALETKLDNAARLENLRTISNFTKIELDFSDADASAYSMDLIDLVYEIEVPHKLEAIDLVMKTFDNSFTSGERDGPSKVDFMLNGHFKTMLKRYLFAGSIFCKGKRVYDCCSGRGWGAYLLSLYARHIYAVDYDSSIIQQCSNFWPSDNVTWMHGNVLNPNLFEAEKFDVVTGMEIIEHFTKPDGTELIHNIQSILKPGGYFVGTSAFPPTREIANKHPGLNKPDHLYIWASRELTTELDKYFSEVSMINGWMVIARK